MCFLQVASENLFILKNSTQKIIFETNPYCATLGTKKLTKNRALGITIVSEGLRCFKKLFKYQSFIINPEGNFPDIYFGKFNSDHLLKKPQPLLGQKSHPKIECLSISIIFYDSLRCFQTWIKVSKMHS